MKIDLHCHSTASDGELSPKEVIQIALNKKLKAIALTDHDTLTGLKEAKKFSKNKNIEFVQGIELSCTDEKITSRGIHVIGLFIDPNNQELIKVTKFLYEERKKQKKEILKKLNSLGLKLTFEEVLKQSKKSPMGKPHIAKALMKKYPSKYKNLDEIFEKILGENKKADVKQKSITLEKTIKLIKNANGISILAHPGFYKNDLEKTINRFAYLGGDGIELDYPYEFTTSFNKKSGKEIKEKIKKIAKKKKLLISGGTDFHSPSNKFKIGDNGINFKEFKLLKKKNGKSNDS